MVAKRTGEPQELISFKINRSAYERILERANRKGTSPGLLVRGMVEERFSAERLAQD